VNSQQKSKVGKKQLKTLYLRIPTNFWKDIQTIANLFDECSVYKFTQYLVSGHKQSKRRLNMVANILKNQKGISNSDIQEQLSECLIKANALTNVALSTNFNAGRNIWERVNILITIKNARLTVYWCFSINHLWYR
jgi:hypothetical protein